MEHILSIGLNVGDSEPTDQLNATLIILAKYTRVIKVKMGSAEWQGVPERFVMARVSNGAPLLVAQNMARQLRQDAIAVLADGAQQWVLAYADGRVLHGASIKDFPVILGAELNAADARADLEAAAEAAPIAIGKLDDRPHGAVQAWSRGPIFPFVIVRSEVDEFPTWRAINGPGGAQTSSYFSYDACERAAMDHLQAVGRG